MFELTREKALELHHQMWEDMQNFKDDDGKEPLGLQERNTFKLSWIEEHFPDVDTDTVAHGCFLCEYTKQEAIRKGIFDDTVVHMSLSYCPFCPINWAAGDASCTAIRCPCEKGNITWYESPISEILALPERKVEWWNDV